MNDQQIIDLYWRRSEDAVRETEAKYGPYCRTVAGNILAESGLSFLGLGVQLPTPTWGNMIRDAQTLSTLMYRPWMWIPAGVVLVVTVVCINFVGDGLRAALDPKIKI